MDYKQIIYKLELSLLEPEVRKSKESISELLASDFIEFCSSGKVYNYNEDDTFFQDGTSYIIDDFNVKILNKDCVLATYKVTKSYQDTTGASLRSSIWKNEKDKWKMIFHQGTDVKREE